jgi:hypothetical protein
MMALRCVDALLAARFDGSILPRAIVVISFGAALSCAACSAPWQGLPPARVSSQPYEDMTCDRLKFEKAKLTQQAGDLSPSLFPTGGEEKRKADLAQVDGAITAIGKAQADQKCPGFANGVAVGVDPSRPF